MAGAEVVSSLADELDVARARFPNGTQLSARVSPVPKPGAIGVFLVADEPPEGFVDVLHLPSDPDSWPKVGDVSDFEVLQHRPGQMRLWPLDPTWRGEDRLLPWDEQWATVTRMVKPGDRVQETVAAVFTANRECSVEVAGVIATCEWSAPRPEVGQSGEFEVVRVLESTRRLLVARVDSSR